MTSDQRTQPTVRIFSRRRQWGFASSCGFFKRCGTARAHFAWMLLIAVIACDLQCPKCEADDAEASSRSALKSCVVCIPSSGAVFIGPFHEVGKGPPVVTHDHLEGICSVVQLRSIALSSVRMDVGAIEYLACEKDLESLSLGSVDLTDDGLRHLSKASSLRSLYIVNTSVTDEGLLTLAALKDLEYLYLLGNRSTTRKGAIRLQEELPNCKIVYDEANGDEDIERQLDTLPKAK